MSDVKRYQHNCPTHGWETCAGPNESNRHGCTKVPATEMPATFVAETREVPSTAPVAVVTPEEDDSHFSAEKAQRVDADVITKSDPLGSQMEGDH